MFSFLIVICLSLAACPIVQGYLVTVDAATENECFHELVDKGVKIGFSYEVFDGGFYDIDVHITDPNKAIIHQEEKSSGGKLTFETDLNGQYEFCFGNKQSSRAPKSVIFDIDRSDEDKRRTAASDSAEPGKTEDKDDETTKLKTMVDNLLLATVSSRHDVRYLLARDKVHRKVSEESNSRIVLWSMVEFIILLSVTLGQVWYLKRFFETRRKA